MTVPLVVGCPGFTTFGLPVPAELVLFGLPPFPPGLYVPVAGLPPLTFGAGRPLFPPGFARAPAAFPGFVGCCACGAAAAGFDLSLSLSPNAWIEDEMAKRKAAKKIHLLKLFRFECM
jgi:hypothetical protein